MNKNYAINGPILRRRSDSVSIVFLGLCIIIGSWFISHSLDNNKSGQYRYEFISANQRNIIIFDKKTGNYWQKLIEESEESTEWKKQESPIVKLEQR
ncbi:hypothetical protein QWT69_12865 [Sporosarcina oncorhynchi]|uniref:Uncharacterized protein n=1 Tax=Sporosarcina oncorhynchi TaxID=3056444 RepID=A0ABZ0L3K9_9BACL|nr:hypothetical protein [Sporosarcina sp. T2O-4]WOV86759.1 hypothetical protein QWT69_12865 [Sporosarcina sp. T2O-4]